MALEGRPCPPTEFSQPPSRQVAEEYLAGAPIDALGAEHEVARKVIRIWVAKYRKAPLKNSSSMVCLPTNSAIFTSCADRRGIGMKSGSYSPAWSHQDRDFLMG
jgi:hypothetical protein